jgi:DNA-binding GntR family transcriptional regulator
MTIRFERLDQRTTPDSVHRVLREAILDGRLPTGGQLREAHIAADLGVSRAPLREALTRLEEEGLIVKVPFRGAFVAEVSARTIAEIASVRLLIEPYAADLAAEQLRGEERGRLTSAVEALRSATHDGDIPASIDAHLHFHRLFYECSGNSVLTDLWAGWESKLRLFLAADHRAYSDLGEIATAHERLAALVVNGKMTLFRQELAQHIHVAFGSSLEDRSTSAEA